MERFIIQLNEEMVRIFAKYEEMVKQPRDYGCGVIIYPSDIHMIETLGNHPDSNVTQISEIMGITKGSVSKLIKKLETKGFLRKYHYLDNKKEVFFKLTNLGHVAFKGHYELHESRSSEIYKKFNGYSDEKKEFIISFLNEFENLLDQYIESF